MYKMGYYNEMKKDLEYIYCALGDEESKDWFDVRVEYMISGNEEHFFDSIFALGRKYPKNWCHLGMERFVKGKSYKGIVIYGCGHNGRILKGVLELCGYTVNCWCDSNRRITGNELNGLRIISPEELVEKYQDYLVIISTMQYKVYIYEHLRALGFPLEMVSIFDENASDWGIGGKQYFDLFLPEDEEVFVDAGAYNGDTIFDFLEWCQGKEYRIYSLEPLEHMCEFVKKRLRENNISNVHMIMCAAWCKEEELNFVDRGDGSSIEERGGFKVKGNSIDNIVGKDKVTFIKLDIEGAELEALKGASTTIRENHPKLAICIYHKPFDILEIGKYILSLYPDYKLYVRHYSLTMCETVLYAIP